MIESTEPMLHPIKHGDRVVILNEWVGRYIDKHTLEQLLSRYANNSDKFLEQEISLQAHVNARWNPGVLPRYFVVSSIRA